MIPMTRKPPRTAQQEEMGYYSNRLAVHPDLSRVFDNGSARPNVYYS